jgi:hypothetical protein
MSPADIDTRPQEPAFPRVSLLFQSLPSFFLSTSASRAEECVASHAEADFAGSTTFLNARASVRRTER